MCAYAYHMLRRTAMLPPSTVYIFMGIFVLMCAYAYRVLRRFATMMHTHVIDYVWPHGSTPHRLTLHSLFVSVDAPHYRQRDRGLCEVTKET